MKIKACTFLTIMSMGAAAVAGPFSLTVEKGLQISFGGTPLVVEEALVLTPPLPPGAAPEAPPPQPVSLLRNPQTNISDLDGNRRVCNVYGETDGVKYRREVSAAADGSEVELAFMAHCPAYQDHLTGSSIRYQLRLPLAPFEGCTYTALYGRSSKLNEVSGTITASSGRIANAPIRQIAFSGQGRQLVIDCNPKGVNAHGDYPPNAVVGVWDLIVESDCLVLSRPYTPLFFGGMLAGHLVFYEGTHEDFTRRHATDSYRYFSEMLPDRQFVFGARKFGKQYTDAGVNAFSPEKGFGWLATEGLRVSTHRPQGALYSAVRGNGEASFRMTGLRSGVHIITIVTGVGLEGAGPFSVSCNGRVVASDLSIAPLMVQTLSFPVWLESGEALFTFTGNWAISTLNDQLLQTSYEDYSFRRGFWRHTGLPEPSVMFSSASYAKAPEFTVSVSKYPLPEPGQETAAPLKSWDLPTSHAVFKPGEDWRGRANIGSLGPSNNGTFSEFNTPELIARRIQELKADNLNVILTNGMLSRHTYPTHLQRAEKNLADFVRAGHPHGIKFVDHQDHSLLWDMESGFRVLVANMPYLQQTIDGQLTARGFCPSNSQYFAIFADRIAAHVQATGIDGIMIDEVSFHGLKFCGCADCRQAFTAESGWHLPADECSPDLFNKESALWRAWLRWRQKRLGDFWYRLKERIRTFKPDFVIMGYSTHYGMTSTYGSLTQGSALEQSTRGWDFVGTEIMTRNIYANYRSVMTLRQAKGQFQHSAGLPVYGLVYTSGFNWDLMYFGWALNNMLGQTTWEMTGRYCPPDKSNYRLFTVNNGNMAMREAEPVTGVAMLFSNQSRDWPRGVAYPPDVLGMSQLLNLKHIPHVFINETGLKQDILKKYKVLFVCNAMSLSDANLAVIREFARQGGTVYLSNRVGASNENGDLRSSWPFADLFPLERIDKPSPAVKMYAGPTFAEALALAKPISGVVCRATAEIAAPVRVLWEYEGPSGTRFPAVLEVPLGAGRVVYSPLLLGAPANATEIAVGREFTFERQLDAEEIAHRVLADVLGKETTPWVPLTVPEAVLTNIFRDRGETVVHFLNATGSRMEPGQTVSASPPDEPFPALEKDIRFVIRLPSLQRAYVVSPDFAGEVELKTRQVELGAYEVVLPADRLKIYTLVRIR
ncbi:MAG: hypothetical protein ACOX6W_02465 [Lentisphaeria bacterium]|jgi:hypothetical protein